MFDGTRGVTLRKWADGVGVAKGTALRWVREGMLEASEIGGNYYVTDEQDERFWSKTQKGTFKLQAP